MAERVSIRGVFRRFFEDSVGALGGRSPFGRLIQKAASDAEVRSKLVQSPKIALAEAGVVLPDDLKVEVLENSDKVIHLVLPPLVSAGARGGEAS